MTVSSRVSTEVLITKKWQKKKASPERTMIWVEPKSKTDKKVPVIYYLCQNGHLEHPHFMEVPISSYQGLYLKDVMNRLNFLRGKGMASVYSWSSKRSYRNGYVWHDLSENDLIHPTNGHEYILKGSELLRSSTSFRSYETASSETKNSDEDCNSSITARRRKNQSWSSFDHNPHHEYRVYKVESSRELAGNFAAADAATQTDEKRRRRRSDREETEEEKQNTTELSKEELSPPPSMSSSEGVSGSRDVDQSASIRNQTVQNEKTKASYVLMHLISCGSVSVKDRRSMKSKGDQRCLMRVQYGDNAA